LEDFDFHIPINSDLAAESELAENPIFFKAVVLHLVHGRFLRRKLHTAGCTTGLPAASVTYVNPVLFEGVY
jgi:hypothetical protein